MRRQFLPFFGQRGQECLYVSVKRVSAGFVRFCKDDSEWNSVLTEPSDKLQVNLLRLKTAVYQYEKAGETVPAENVLPNDSLNLHLLLPAALCVAISRQIHQIPFLVYKKMVDEQGLAWR